MSQTEYHSGKLIKAFTGSNPSFIEGIAILKEKYNIPDSDIEEEDEYVYSDIVHYIRGEFYVIEDHKKFDPDYINDTTVNADGSISFMVSFYNGGACLSEVIGDILKKAKC